MNKTYFVVVGLIAAGAAALAVTYAPADARVVDEYGDPDLLRHVKSDLPLLPPDKNFETGELTDIPRYVDGPFIECAYGALESYRSAVRAGDSSMTTTVMGNETVTTHRADLSDMLDAHAVLMVELAICQEHH